MNGDLLLIIDMQNVYKKGGKWECLNTEEAAKNILALEAGGKFEKVILTKFIADENASGVWQDYNHVNAAVNNDEYANALLPELSVLSQKYPVYTKSKYSSLEIPEVKEACLNARRVFVTGVVAECCVLSTVFALIDAGVYTVYVTDAVSGLDKAKEDATILTLSGLSPLHVAIESTQNLLR